MGRRSFLHGLAGSGRFWGQAFDALAGRARLVVADLLGVGDSVRPGDGYTAADHVAPVAACWTKSVPTSSCRVASELHHSVWSK